MSIQTYSVDRFIGLNQSGDENLMSPACTPDAANMCTDGGELRVAYGFTRLFEAAVPGTLRIDFFTLYRTNGAEIPVVIAGGVCRIRGAHSGLAGGVSWRPSHRGGLPL